SLPWLVAKPLRRRASCNAAAYRALGPRACIFRRGVTGLHVELVSAVPVDADPQLATKSVNTGRSPFTNTHGQPELLVLLDLGDTLVRSQAVQMDRQAHRRLSSGANSIGEPVLMGSWWMRLSSLVNSATAGFCPSWIVTLGGDRLSKRVLSQ